MDVAHLARQAADLSQQDRDELGRFAEYLRAPGHARRRADRWQRRTTQALSAPGRWRRRDSTGSSSYAKRSSSRGGNVDVFGAIHAIDLPLLLRPLQGLLGAYLRDPAPGVLVTTQRPMSIQRFTAAHELGHFSLRHDPSLDDESILRRMPIGRTAGGRFSGGRSGRIRCRLHDAALADRMACRAPGLDG